MGGVLVTSHYCEKVPWLKKLKKEKGYFNLQFQWDRVCHDRADMAWSQAQEAGIYTQEAECWHIEKWIDRLNIYDR